MPMADVGSARNIDSRLTGANSAPDANATAVPEPATASTARGRRRRSTRDAHTTAPRTALGTVSVPAPVVAVHGVDRQRDPVRAYGRKHDPSGRRVPGRPQPNVR
jgi:hypothetical protein